MYNFLAHIVGPQAAHDLNMELQNTENRVKPVYTAIKPVIQPIVDASVNEGKQTLAVGLEALIQQHVPDPTAQAGLSQAFAALLGAFHVTL